MLANSVGRLPIEQQIAEIDRRLTEEWERRRELGLPMSPINICDVLCIDKATFSRWKDGSVGQPQIEEQTADAVDFYQQRSELLGAWMIKCEASWLDIAGNSDGKSAVSGANNVLNKLFGYDRRGEERQQSLRYEEMLRRIRSRQTARSPAEKKGAGSRSAARSRSKRINSEGRGE